MTTDPMQAEASERFTEMELQIIRQTFANCLNSDYDAQKVADSAECSTEDVLDLMRKLNVGTGLEDDS